ncbi:hypothetical protein BDB01DRAFT_804589 [Pilobolus umbonatus]|nr:hypothetical protein BDB01DRAFT_804589 [Pilobolus umbonatus]
METIKRSNNLVECAIDLTQRLDQEPLKGLNAFLLTDYPHRFTEEQQLMASENNATKKELQKWVKSSSTTFHFSAFTPNHHKAIRILYQNHPFILFDSEYHGESSTPDGWNLLPLPADQDSGWLGILDKLMAIRSDQFYAGKPKFCARRSTFTAQIINERFLMDPSRQPIQYFG